MSSVDIYFIGYVRVHCFPGAELQSTFIYITQLILSKSSDSPHLLFLNPYHGLFASLAPTHLILPLYYLSLFTLQILLEEGLRNSLPLPFLSVKQPKGQIVL